MRAARGGERGLERRVTAAEAERTGIDAPNGAQPATVHEGGDVGRIEEGLLRQLEQLVVAQQRTNQLLELALGAAFDDDLSLSPAAPASPVDALELGGRRRGVYGARLNLRLIRAQPLG